MTQSTAQKPVKPNRVVIRSWPKIILMLPTLVMAGVAGAIMMTQEPPATNADFGFPHLVCLGFLFILLINLTMLLYDLSLRGFIIVCLLILVLVLIVLVINLQIAGGAWQAIGRALSIKVYANAAFYFLFGLVLLFNLVIAWVITRFHYWVVEHNEIIIHRGFLQEVERHPTAQARFKLVIEDVVEYGMLGSGRLVFYFGDDKSEHELSTVPFVHSKARILDELLGRVAVTQA
ncbi:MAG: hypothetical protein GXY55_02630 [Phycisphaerae bacterium]|nr:hypothetical protein [Phycisphaerae bacterium]